MRARGYASPTHGAILPWPFELGGYPVLFSLRDRSFAAMRSGPPIEGCHEEEQVKYVVMAFTQSGAVNHVSRPKGSEPARHETVFRARRSALRLLGRDPL